MNKKVLIDLHEGVVGNSQLKVNKRKSGTLKLTAVHVPKNENFKKSF